MIRQSQPLALPPAPEPLVLVPPFERDRPSPLATHYDVAACREVLRRHRGRVLTEDDVQAALVRLRGAK